MESLLLLKNCSSLDCKPVRMSTQRWSCGPVLR